MNDRAHIHACSCTRISVLIFVSVCLGSCLGSSPHASSQVPNSNMLRKDPVMTRHAEGTFEVKTTPLAGDDATAGTLIGR